nr:hypothetical protein [Geotalea uraniireducens]
MTVQLPLGAKVGVRLPQLPGVTLNCPASVPATAMELTARHIAPVLLMMKE